jgi:hypothetical protein
VEDRLAPIERGVWWELMAECARVAPGKEIHQLELQEVSEPLRWPLRLYKEAMERATERGESKPDAVARAEVFGRDSPKR